MERVYKINGKYNFSPTIMTVKKLHYLYYKTETNRLQAKPSDIAAFITPTLLMTVCVLHLLPINGEWKTFHEIENGSQDC